MGKISKGIKCSVQNCLENAARSLPLERFNQVRNVNLKLKPDVRNRVYLCEKHYKMIRKELKKIRKIEKKRFGI